MAGKYDFDTPVDRHGTSCIKYDFGQQRKGRTDLLPMWVADMDFKLPDEILAEFHKRIDHGIFGYTDPDKSYFTALNWWFGTQHGYTVEPEMVTLGCGIVYGLATGVKAFTDPGDAILIQQPVYYPFREVIEDNDRIFINNQLHYEHGRYTIDFDDFEAKIVDNNVRAFILCNPHNPVGRVWKKDELTRMADICLKHNVILMSDEIHCDFVFPGYKFTSMMTLGEKYRQNLVVYTSPSKTFNVAGLQPANIIVPNPVLRAKYRKANAAAGYSQGGVMAQTAVKVVYNMGAEWKKELVDYIYGNVVYFGDYIRRHFPRATFVQPEGTYLMWVDFSGYRLSNEELEHLIVDEANLWLDSGSVFGAETAQFERFNIACPRTTVEQALHQLDAAFKARGL